MIMHKTGLVSAGLLMTLGLTATAASKPNILLIMADDQAKHALTPNSFCAPSRAVVLM